MRTSSPRCPNCLPYSPKIAKFIRFRPGRYFSFCVRGRRRTRKKGATRRQTAPPPEHPTPESKSVSEHKTMHKSEPSRAAFIARGGPLRNTDGKRLWNRAVRAWSAGRRYSCARTGKASGPGEGSPVRPKGRPAGREVTLRVPGHPPDTVQRVQRLPAGIDQGRLPGHGAHRRRFPSYGFGLVASGRDVSAESASDGPAESAASV